MHSIYCLSNIFSAMMHTNIKLDGLSSWLSGRDGQAKMGVGENTIWWCSENIIWLIYKRGILYSPPCCCCIMTRRNFSLANCVTTSASVMGIWSYMSACWCCLCLRCRISCKINSYLNRIRNSSLRTEVPPPVFA